MNTEVKPEYLVMVRWAKMPPSCWGRYCRVALVKVDRNVLDQEGLREPRMISERAKGVIEIIAIVERCFCGVTDRDATGRAIARMTQRKVDLEGVSV